MNLVEYHQNIEQIWLKIEEMLEDQDCDADCDTQGSVFTVTFSDRSQIVINKQEPLMELWLASKVGGFHFSYREEKWIDSEGKSFWQHFQEAVQAHGESAVFVE